MTAPILSTVTLITEFLVTASVLTVFQKSIKENKFPTLLGFGTLAYEVIFNITYMLASSRKREVHTGGLTIDVMLGISHGILSLIMFVSLIVFFITAFRAYKKGSNFFAVHKGWVITFIFFWITSVLSGATLYFLEYVL